MRHGVWRAVPHWRKYCLTKQTATHDTRLRRACSAVKCLLQNSRRFFSMDPGKGPSVGLAIFYEIFYEKSIFFFEEKTAFLIPIQLAGFLDLFSQKSLKSLPGRQIYFFFKLLLLSQLARKMVAVQGNIAAFAVMLLFSQHTRSSSG